MEPAANQILKYQSIHRGDIGIDKRERASHKKSLKYIVTNQKKILPQSHNTVDSGDCKMT